MQDRIQIFRFTALLLAVLLLITLIWEFPFADDLRPGQSRATPCVGVVNEIDGWDGTRCDRHLYSSLTDSDSLFTGSMSPIVFSRRTVRDFPIPARKLHRLKRVFLI
jgi:hypothetical protein